MIKKLKIDKFIGISNVNVEQRDQFAVEILKMVLVLDADVLEKEIQKILKIKDLED